MADLRVNFWPTAEPLRAPTMATMGIVGEVEPAFDVEQRRRRVDLGERRRIARLADGDEACARALRRGELGLGFGLAAEADVVSAAAAARQHRQRIDGGLGAAELVDQRAEGGRPDILAADQAEPGEALTTVEP